MNGFMYAVGMPVALAMVVYVLGKAVTLRWTNKY